MHHSSVFTLMPSQPNWCIMMRGMQTNCCLKLSLLNQIYSRLQNKVSVEGTILQGVPIKLVCVNKRWIVAISNSKQGATLVIILDRSQFTKYKSIVNDIFLGSPCSSVWVTNWFGKVTRLFFSLILPCRPLVDLGC